MARTDTLTQEELATRFGLSQGEVSRVVVSGELYANVPPPSTKEQEQIARKKAITEMVERRNAALMASIPVVDDGPSQSKESPFYQPPGSHDSSGRQP